MDIAQIEHTSTFNFLGIIVEEHLKWDEHVNKIALKISKTIGIINKLKHFLSSYILHTLYNSLILPHIHYGLLIWGCRYERIFKLQQQVIRIITLNQYNSHSGPLFKSLKLLKIRDILKLQQLKFIYKLLNKSLPNYFEYMYPNHRYNIHSYNTRSRSACIRHAFAKQSLFGTTYQSC